MSNSKIVHCIYAEKFTNDFIKFIFSKFEKKNHKFLVKKFINYHVVEQENVLVLDKKISFISEVFFYGKAFTSADKIVIHGLFNPRLLVSLSLQPWVLSKCCWVIWGGDLYYYTSTKSSLMAKLYEAFRRFVIPKIGFLVTQVRGDYEFARSWYAAKGKHINCFVYLSNLFRYEIVDQRNDGFTNILLGNSASPSNNHLEALRLLEPYHNNNIRIFCPLSYGENALKSTIIETGKDLFGEKFIPLLEMMPYEDYLKLLGKMDIAIFAHTRQQASGNAINLIGMGKKIYMRTDISTWDFYRQLGLTVYDINELNLTLIDSAVASANNKIVSSYFSEENLLTQLNEVFSS